MFLRGIVISLISLALAGCLTIAPHGMTGSQLQQFRIVDVRVEGVERIRSWPGEEEVFLRTNAVDPETANRILTEPAHQFPQLRNHFQRVLDARFRSEFASLINPIFNGKRPVVAVVRLKEFDVPSVARRVFVDNQAKIHAEIDILDRSTGSLILRYDGRWKARQLVGGLMTGIAVALERSDVGYSMITDYLTAYRNWLLQN